MSTGVRVEMESMWLGIMVRYVYVTKMGRMSWKWKTISMNRCSLSLVQSAVWGTGLGLDRKWRLEGGDLGGVHNHILWLVPDTLDTGGNQVSLLLHHGPIYKEMWVTCTGRDYVKLIGVCSLVQVLLIERLQRIVVKRKQATSTKGEERACSIPAVKTLCHCRQRGRKDL